MCPARGRWRGWGASWSPWPRDGPVYTSHTQQLTVSGRGCQVSGRGNQVSVEDQLRHVVSKPMNNERECRISNSNLTFWTGGTPTGPGWRPTWTGSTLTSSPPSSTSASRWRRPGRSTSRTMTGGARRCCWPLERWSGTSLPGCLMAGQALSEDNTTTTSSYTSSKSSAYFR